MGLYIDRCIKWLIETDTASYSLHLFLKIERVRRPWVSAVKLHRKTVLWLPYTYLPFVLKTFYRGLLCDRRTVVPGTAMNVGFLLRSAWSWPGRCAYYLSKAQQQSNKSNISDNGCSSTTPSPQGWKRKLVAKFSGITKLFKSIISITSR